MNRRSLPLRLLVCSLLLAAPVIAEAAPLDERISSKRTELERTEARGAVGNTGASFGAHLHFETRVGGTPQDPMGYL